MKKQKLNTQEELVSFKTAKLAREKGFDWKCEFAYYSLEEGHKANGRLMDFRDAYTSGPSPKHSNELKGNSNYVTAPTQSFLQKWLREEHKIDCMALRYTLFQVRSKKLTQYPSLINCYIWMIADKESSTKYDNYYDTYEEALEDGLPEALKLI